MTFFIIHIHLISKNEPFDRVNLKLKASIQLNKKHNLKFQ